MLNTTSNSTIKNVQTGKQKNIKTKSYNKEETFTYYHLIPIFLLLCVNPLIVRYATFYNDLSKYSWFSQVDLYADVFLLNKLRFLIVIGAIMAVAVMIKLFVDRKQLKSLNIFLPLGVYALLVVLSTVFSRDIALCLKGSFEIFESVFAILTYCIITVYIYLFIKTERDFRYIIYFVIITSLILGVIGVFQYLGYDLFDTNLGYNLIVSSEYQTGEKLTSAALIKGTVYMTLHNPNYVGSYVALVTPVLLLWALLKKSWKTILVVLPIIIGLIISAIGSKSLAGIIGLLAAVALSIIFLWRLFFKKIYIALLTLIILVIGMFFLDNYMGHYFTNKVKANLQFDKAVYGLTDVHTEADGVEITYQGNVMKVKCELSEDGTLTLGAYDSNNAPIAFSYNATDGTYTNTDTRFMDMIMGFEKDYPSIFYLVLEGQVYDFTFITEDGSYKYINIYGKPCDMITAPAAIFNGYEAFASGRGYIWSRTIPILKNYLFLGSGPNTFVTAFPQTDYLNITRFGYRDQMVTKPHNMYFQMWVETGALSLIAFLIFYGIYFVTSFKLYIKGCFRSDFAKIGLAIFIGSICYMLTGLANDSSITTAPVFWALLGTGIAVNAKAKPFIKEEAAERKAAKTSD